MSSRKLTLIIFGILLSLSLTAMPMATQAHSFDYGALETTLDIHETQINFHLKVPQQINVDAPDLDTKLQLLEQYFIQNFTIINEDKPCPFKIIKFDSSSTTQTTYDGRFDCPTTAKTRELKIHSAVFTDFFGSYDNFVTIAEGERKSNGILKMDKQDLLGSEILPKEIEQEKDDKFKNQSRFALSKQFVVMGVEHIWRGYDHILFLISVVLLLSSRRKIILVVTSFTLAHSVTLILASLGIVSVPAKIVEPFIALTIIFVAIRNILLLRKKDLIVSAKERWIFTSSLGLVHGLGFASALIAVGIPSHYFVPSLIFFNVGVEIGQIAILLIVVPVLIWTKKFAWQKRLFMIISILIAAIAFIWLLQRLQTI